MPFDRSRKRRLLDTCGHERCYSCIFRSDVCALCIHTDSTPAKVSRGVQRSEEAKMELSDESPLLRIP